ncbi:FHA domain-containing protein [Microbacterium sp. BWT-B31]|uniref:FHA domain-containing protein n=1 Tax=Microbacterium sp. BWT-B31 TaxID=3232072 RepID=UPI0035275DFA
MRVYSSGDWFALARPGVIALLSPGIPRQALDRMWDALRSGGDGLAAVLGALVECCGAGLAALPPFAVVTVDTAIDEARVIVRGEVEASVVAGDTRREISGIGVTTWHESVIGAPQGITLAVPGIRGDALPIVEGIVRASAVTWTVKADAAPPALGQTRLNPVEDAAVRTPPAESIISSIPTAPPPPPPPPQPPIAADRDPDGDHDGETVSLAQLAEIQARLGLVDAVAGHPSPGSRSTTTPTLVVSTGERVRLDRAVVIGRRPRALRATGVVPHLIAVPSPNQDISRSHLELRVEGGDVVAVDLDTTNGTMLLRVGSDPVRLQSGESTLVVAEDRLDLGEGVVLTFEDLA